MNTQHSYTQFGKNEELRNMFLEINYTNPFTNTNNNKTLKKNYGHKYRLVE